MIKGKFEFKELEKYQKQIEKLAKDEKLLDEFCSLCAKELAARLLSLATDRTPIGKDVTYEDEEGKPTVEKNGGTLRRGWISKTEKEAESGSGTPNAQQIREYAQSLEVKKEGTTYTIEITNPVHYGIYVENGHRQEVGRYVPALGKKLVKNWVEGQKMLQLSEEDLEKIMPQVLENKLKKFLEENF